MRWKEVIVIVKIVENSFLISWSMFEVVVCCLGFEIIHLSLTWRWKKLRTIQ